MRKNHSGIISIAVFAATTFLSAACNSENNIVDNNKKIELGSKDGISIIVKEESFDTEIEKQPGSRAVTDPTAINTVDLGDGLTAEVSLQEDEADAHAVAPRTRAPMSDGKYFIFAIDKATNSKVGGVMTGTVKSQVFTRDASSPHISLPQGNYLFYCTTQEDGDQMFFFYPGKNVMADVQEVTVTGGDNMQIAFTMKHLMTRVRFKIVAYTPQIQRASFNFTSEYNQPTAGIWAGGYGSINAYGTINIQPTFVTASPVGNNSKFVLANDFMTDYAYLLPETNGNDLKLNFLDGTAYGNVSLAGKSIDLNVLGQMQRNKSYTVMVKLKATPALYLFNDGTCGVLEEKGSRTPIGIVVTEKTASGKGLAAALNFTPNVIWEQDDPPAGSGNSYQNNKVCYPDPNAGLADMNGYDWTWDKTSSLDGKVRGDEQTKYPAFYVAGHYNPGVTVTGANVGKWFLPSWGQLMEFFKLTAKDLTMPTAGPSPMNPWFGANPTFSDSRALEKLNNYIIQAGGNRFDQSFISTSTQVDGTPTVRRYQPAGCALNVGSGDDRIQVFAIWKTMNNGGVLPFVHF